ncbi:hypothetical protein D2908_05560 [Streptococcus sp. LQJ-218]|nr:hypothetical protein D2908_05560 [Streptococcus sp. LQJ-218]
MLLVWNYYKHFLRKNLKMISYKNKGGLYERQKSFIFYDLHLEALILKIKLTLQILVILVK